MPSVRFFPARQVSFSMLTAARGPALRRALPEHDSRQREIVQTLKARLRWPRTVNIFTLATEYCLVVLTQRFKDQS